MVATNNLAQGGEAVKPLFDDYMARKAAIDAEDSAKVVNLEDKREAQRLQQEKTYLFAHATDARSGKLKPPSLDSLYADQLVSGRNGLWACQASDATGAVIHQWNDTYWHAVNNEVGAGIASDWLEANCRHSATDHLSIKCWKYASTRLRRKNPLPKLDDKRAIVPCADVYLEVFKAGFQALAPDPALGMVHAVNIKTGATAGRPYMPAKELPEDSLFAKFINRAQPDPRVRALIQEQCGMTLLPGNYSSAAWWHGAAGSGKSTLAELVEALHRQSVRLNLETLGDRFSLEPLIGASLILVDEVECEKWAEGRFKTLVSGNGIGIDRKNEKALASYHSRAKWLITANSQPFIRDKSDGVWRRLVVVEWNVVVPEDEREKDFQKIILEKEAKLVLDWMLEGARRIVERGRVMPESEQPEAVRSAKQRARNNCDSVRAWKDEMRVVSAPGHWQLTTDVYAHYKIWCCAQGFLVNEILTSKQFWRGMIDAGLVRPDKKSNRRLDGKQGDYYELKLNGSAADQVNGWAGAHQVSASKSIEDLMPTDEIHGAYEAWAAALDPTNVLDRSEFLVAMRQAGFLDPSTKVSQSIEGQAVECYPLVIAGPIPLVDDEADKGREE